MTKIPSVQGVATSLGILDRIFMFWRSRHPFSMSLGYEATSPPILKVTLTSLLPVGAVHVDHVRIHYGCTEYNHYFVLDPHATQELPPKRSMIWTLPYENTLIGRRTIQKEVTLGSDRPSFDSPADLFRAIAKGGECDSWVEVDFDNRQQRLFKRGRVQSIFSSMLKTAKELARREAQNKDLHSTGGGRADVPPANP